MIAWIKKQWRKLACLAGSIQIHPYPFWIVYEPRKPKVDGETFSAIQSNIKKYDVLTRRYWNYLDSKLLPGYWKHIGVYIGEPGDPNGPVIHATSEGVVVQTLFDFVLADEVGLWRFGQEFKDYDKVIMDQNIECIKGRGYDFDFDAEDDSKLYCSEAVRYIFKSVDHGLKETEYIGKVSILPDAIKESNFTRIC